MKDRKKPKGTKARVQAYKKRLTNIGHAIVIAILVTIIGVSGFFLYSMLHSPPEQNPINPTLQFKPDNPNSQLKAAIVDHLSLTCPNQTFIQTATTTLKEAGYTIDYYPGEKVTVDFYRILPTHRYTIIILRVHSTIMGQFFTSELYSTTKYVNEQLADRLIRVSPDWKPPYYFGISSLFVKYSMKGKFQNTTIFMMGCDGLRYANMAHVFIEKGAKLYIGWNKSVLPSHTDQATTHLLQHLITEKQAIKQAVENTMREVRADPAHKGLLAYYPLEVGEQTIEHMIDEG